MSSMFRLFGSRGDQAQENRTNTTKVSNERLRSRLSEASSSCQGPLQRPALVQQQQHNSENMVTLHARLLQEAEKIRKWKIQTELDLKEKERKMTEALLRIETMKKSILELQLQNEETSSKLEEEITNKGEVLKRIDATREMCNLLKSHASSVIERLTRCETEKTELKYTNREQTKQFQELTEKFKNLKIQVTENTKNSKSHADKERLDHVQKEKILTSKLHDSETQIQNLKDAVEKKDKEIETLETMLQTKMQKVECLEQSTDELQKSVSCLSKDLENREAELKDSALRIAKVQDEKGCLEKKIQILEIDFGNLQASKDDLTLKMTENASDLECQLQLAREDAKMAKTDLEEEQEKLSICKQQLDEANNALENLKSAKDALLMEKKDAEISEDMLKFQISNLVAEKDENKEEIHNLNGEISVLNKKLDRESLLRAQVQGEYDALQEKVAALEVIRSENEDQTASLQMDLNDLQTKVESMETILSKKDAEILKLQGQKEILEQTANSEREKMKQLEAEIKESEESLTEKSEVIQRRKESLDLLSKDLEASRAEREKLEQKLTMSDTEIEKLRNTVEDYEHKVQELTGQLDNVTEQQKESGKSLTAQQKKAATTAKHNKELEKEVRSLKSKLEKEGKALQLQSDELLAVQTEMAALREAKSESQASLQSYREEMKNLKLQCETEQKEARIAMEKAKEMQMNAEKEKEKAQALTDCQLAEMMSTLESYKQNNEKLISDKDLKIEELRILIDKQKAEAMKHGEEKFEWSCLNDSLKNQVTSSEREKEKVMEEVTTLLSEKDLLKKQVVLLENQISDLKLQAVHKPQENCTPLLRNASPPAVEVTPQKQGVSHISQPVTPKISTVPKTPSRSILRMVNSERKRRKVAFNASDCRPSSSDESDIMELDTEAAVCKNAGTPLLFTPRKVPVDKGLTEGYTPKPLSRKPRELQIIQSEENVLSMPNRDETLVKGSSLVSVPLNRKPRGSHSAQTKSPQKTVGTDDTGASSKSLLHSYESDIMQPDRPKTPKIRTAPIKRTDDSTVESGKFESLKAANIRKTPAKKKSKFFSESPRNKTPATKPKGSEKDTSKMAWFDLDSVYGFGPED
ncbi:synaptonemal complex protein 1-like [Elysia marginata]|uniref:Synaptonemal complex protein 1-like n=1 Tax=Elysia marginata TaxID=1093978 RepID=A0AAV4HSI3_9GAST|nr:synaptonemal complex protein 1-like [Elysia marginata]